MGNIFDIIGTAIVSGLLLTLLFHFVRSIRFVPQQRAYILERLGKYHRTLKPGPHFMIPFVEKIAFIQDLREATIEVPPQMCFTRDNVKVEVDGVLYVKVTDAQRASYGVTDYLSAAISLAQTTTRSVIGTMDLDRTFEERDDINTHVRSVLQAVEDSWGIRVERYEIKNIVPPNSVRDSMERQMAAERQRRALLAESQGQKESMINDSEGLKRELINQSEGDMQRRINEAEGHAAEILALAKASADAIRKIGRATSRPGGEDALKLRLSQQYFEKLKDSASARQRVVLPANLMRVDDLLERAGLKQSNEPIHTELESRSSGRPIPSPNDDETDAFLLKPTTRFVDVE